MRRVGVVLLAAVIALGSAIVMAAPAQARSCPPTSVGGPTIGVVTVKGRQVPLKSVTFPNGGTLNPPASNRVAGLSKRNASLGSKKGTTIITWHVRYGPGCNGSLNPVLRMPKGATFTAQMKGGPLRTFRITKHAVVPKTGLKRAWFRKNGPHRLVLLTCADLAGGVFRKTEVVIAAPVKTPPVVVAPTEATAPASP